MKALVIYDSFLGPLHDGELERAAGWVTKIAEAG